MAPPLARTLCLGDRQRLSSQGRLVHSAAPAHHHTVNRHAVAGQHLHRRSHNPSWLGFWKAGWGRRAQAGAALCLLPRSQAYSAAQPKAASPMQACARAARHFALPPLSPAPAAPAPSAGPLWPQTQRAPPASCRRPAAGGPWAAAGPAGGWEGWEGHNNLKCLLAETGNCWPAARERHHAPQV